MPWRGCPVTSVRTLYAFPSVQLLGLANSAQGAFYKFGVTVQSKGFSEAPDVVLKSVHRLQWAQKEASDLTKGWITGLGLEASLDFNVSEPINECLVLGYMQNDRIGVSRRLPAKRVRC